MLTYFYVKLILSALGGIFLSVLVKARTTHLKAQMAGGSVPLWQFIKDDSLSIIGAIVSIVMILLPVSEILKPEALIVIDKDYTVWVFKFTARSIFNFVVMAMMGFAGYSGMDLLLKLYSVANTKVNNKLKDFTENK